ncbi:hypothetical protein NKW43_04510 [Gluconobacter albidus]|uniref:hypothetical protein n=1 Tax=Gluconobacter albidus TaxID=318683 RepID=UPI0020A22B77|nr:hypothetical protein [Gluconobacter albidus]MCP1272948.1 hypothetical protein [Gluconobacter albidus]
MSAALKTTLLRNGAFIAFLLIATFWIDAHINRSIFIDNDMFRHALDHQSLPSFLHMRYMTWSGRVVIEAALAETIRYALFWKLLIPFCAVLLAYAIWSCTLRSSLKPAFGIPLVMGLFLLLPHEVTEESVYWLSGFYNYLLPVSFAFFSISVFLRQNEAGNTMRFLSLAALPIGCSIEQSSLLLLFCTVISTALSALGRRTVSLYSALYLTLAAILSAIVLAAPGNGRRYVAEIGNWLPEFPQYDTLQKLSLALDRIHRTSISPDNHILLAALGLSLCFLAFVKQNRGFQDMAAMGVMLLGLLLMLPTHLLGALRCDRFLYDLNWVSLNTYVAFFLTLCLFFSILWCALSLKNAATLLSFLTGGFIITILTGLSPTIYASSHRILLVLDLTLLLYTCGLIHTLLTQTQARFLR